MWTRAYTCTELKRNRVRIDRVPVVLMYVRPYTEFMHRFPEQVF